MADKSIRDVDQAVQNRVDHSLTKCSLMFRSDLVLLQSVAPFVFWYRTPYSDSEVDLSDNPSPRFEV
eukprot:925495-Rhodomonas_salina.1